MIDVGSYSFAVRKNHSTLRLITIGMGKFLHEIRPHGQKDLSQ